MAGSAIPEAKANLLALCQAQPGLASVAVSWGVPAAIPDVFERVYIGKGKSDRDWANLAGGARPKLDESIRVELIVEVHQPGATERAAEERAWALLREVETGLADDPRLGDPNTFYNARVSPAEDESGPTDDGWLARVRATVTVEARI